jgi:hypothetical protein
MKSKEMEQEEDVKESRRQQLRPGISFHTAITSQLKQWQGLPPHSVS